MFVLTPGEAESSELTKICALRLSAPVRKQLLLIADGQKRSPDPERQDNDPGSTDGLLEPEMVSNYAGWLDQRSTRHLKDILAIGNFLLFFQVSNPSQEVDAFNSLSNYCTGAVRLHDLPVQ